MAYKKRVKPTYTYFRLTENCRVSQLHTLVFLFILSSYTLLYLLNDSHDFSNRNVGCFPLFACLCVCVKCPVHVSRVNIIVLTILEIYFKFQIYFLSKSGLSAVIYSLVDF